MTSSPDSIRHSASSPRSDPRVFLTSLNRVGDIRRADLDARFNRAAGGDRPPPLLRSSSLPSPSIPQSPLRPRAILDPEDAPERALSLLPLRPSLGASIDPVPGLAARVTVGLDDFGLLPDLDAALQRGVADVDCP
jgi:hypothetical protein